MHVFAAVHIQGLAGDEVAGIGCQEYHCADQVVGLLGALETAPPVTFGLTLQILGSRGGKLGIAFGEARGDGVDCDIVVPHFPRQRPGEADNAGL